LRVWMLVPTQLKTDRSNPRDASGRRTYAKTDPGYLLMLAMAFGAIIVVVIYGLVQGSLG